MFGTFPLIGDSLIEWAPDGEPLDGIPLHPYYTVKDLYGIAVFLVLFAAVLLLFFVPWLDKSPVK